MDTSKPSSSDDDQHPARYGGAERRHTERPDRRAALEATRRALKPGGVLVVSTPNFDALSRYALGVDWAVLSPLEHVYYFTELTLAKMLASAGFAVLKPVRDAIGRGPVETMNYRYTNAPGTIRTRVYAAAVNSLGAATYGTVQSGGRGDALVAIARPGSRGQTG